MGERHVDHLFSLAYDGALDGGERRRYDEHLAGCARCTEAAAEFAVAVDAVRALPAARMPVRVVLPATPPEPERRSLALPSWLHLPHYPGAAWGAGAMAAAGIVAVVVAVHAHGGGAAGGGGVASTANQHAALAPEHIQDGGAAGAAPNRGAGGSTGAGCGEPAVVTGLDPSRLSGSGQPAGFANRVAVTNPSRPGQELVLATTSSHYAPGSQVLVVAALTTTGEHQEALIPCVTLDGPAAGPQVGASAATPAATAGGGEPSATASSPDMVAGPANAYSFAPLGPPLAFSAPTAKTAAGSIPLQLLTIPGNVPRGTVLQLVAVVPAGLPGGSDRPALEAVLTVVVS